MTKRKTPVCWHCKNQFDKQWVRARYCSTRCAILSSVRVDANGCWIWTGAKNDKGYGQINFNQKRLYTHRAMFETLKHPLNGAQVCHKCDTPLCCNPDHMFAGTQKDNMVDKMIKERYAGYKLSKDLADEIRGQYPEASLSKLAKKYGVAKNTISCVVNGRTWTNDPAP